MLLPFMMLLTLVVAKFDEIAATRQLIELYEAKIAFLK